MLSNELNNFKELTYEDTLGVTGGGVALGVALWKLAKICGVVGVTSFIGGAIYEFFMGK